MAVECGSRETGYDKTEMPSELVVTWTKNESKNQESEPKADHSVHCGWQCLQNFIQTGKYINKTLHWIYIQCIL